MASDLKEMVDHLNVTNSSNDSSDPVRYVSILFLTFLSFAVSDFIVGLYSFCFRTSWDGG